MWKLCRKYKCCNNEACLQKCSAICDNCMSAPYTFQVPAHVKIQSQMSRDSTGLTLISHNRPGSLPQVQRNAGNIVRQPHSKLNPASHGASATSLSRHSSSRSSRQIATNTHGVRQITHSAKQALGQGPDLSQPQKVAYASVHQNETWNRAFKTAPKITSQTLLWSFFLPCRWLRTRICLEMGHGLTWL